MLGPGGRNDNQVTEAFFHLIMDEATGNRMTSLKTFIPNFLTLCGQDLRKKWRRGSLPLLSWLLPEYGRHGAECISWSRV